MVSERFLNKFAEVVVVGIGVEMSKEMTVGFQNSKNKSQKAVPLYKTTHCKTISTKKRKKQNRNRLYKSRQLRDRKRKLTRRNKNRKRI